MPPLTTRIDDDGVAWVTIDHPPTNLFDLELMLAFDQVSRALAEDDAVRCVVVDSADPDIWIAHADVSLILQMPDEEPPDEVGFFHAIGERFRTMPKATIALIEGVVRGGGAETALGFDMRFGTVGRTVMGFPETLLGIMPGGGGTQRLPRVVGRARALEVILGGLDVDAVTAERWGWLNRAFSGEGEARAHVASLARRIASTPALAQRVAKQSVDNALTMGVDDGLIAEAKLFRTLGWSPEGRALMEGYLARDGQSRDAELRGDIAEPPAGTRG